MTQDPQAQPPLIDPNLMLFLRAAHPLAASRLQQTADYYRELQQYRWTLRDLIEAAQTGYNYAAHLAPVRGRWSFRNWKAYSGPEVFREWVSHYYRRMKATSIGMSEEEFLEQWCGFASFMLRERRSLEIMHDYMAARRRGIPHSEAAFRCSYYPRHIKEYIQLRRRKFTREEAEALMEAYAIGCFKRQPHYLGFSVKYVVEAHRRGATLEELKDGVQNGTSQQLALKLRKAARATSE